MSGEYSDAPALLSAAEELVSNCERMLGLPAETHSVDASDDEVNELIAMTVDECNLSREHEHETGLGATTSTGREEDEGDEYEGDRAESSLGSDFMRALASEGSDSPLLEGEGEDSDPGDGVGEGDESDSLPQFPSQSDLNEDSSSFCTAAEDNGSLWSRDSRGPSPGSERRDPHVPPVPHQGEIQTELHTAPSEQLAENWMQKDSNFFILSTSGKPIYCNSGEEDELVGLMALITALVSVVEDQGDSIRHIVSGNTLIVFIVRGPICLVATRSVVRK
eukprot:gene24359-9972_t